MQDFEPFHVQLRGKNTHPSRVAARSRQAGRKPTAYHVIGHADDGDRLGRALRRSDGGVAEGDDEINVLRHEFAGQRGRSLAAGLGPNKQEVDIASLFPANRLHVAPKRFSEGLQHILPIGSQYADHGHATLLRARRERPRGRRAAEQRYELPPFHSITSSARASKVAGTSRPSAFAVARLITRSKRVA